MAQEHRNHPARLDLPRAACRGAALAAWLAVIFGITACRLHETAPDAPPPVVTNAASSDAPSTNAPALSATAKPEFQKLLGRWTRTDGDYILEVKSIAADGKLEAAYFNPNPIHVAQATVKDSAGAARMFVELRDTGYPGCTYNLVFMPANDTLVGTYYQAAMQQEYSVQFERVK